MVALPIDLAGIVAPVAHGIDPPGDEGIRLDMGGDLFIIGFPFGRTGGAALAIWGQGSLATEPDVDYEELPCVLVDSRTRPGQSGSPVIAYVPRGGTLYMKRGDVHMMSDERVELVGVYSGRMNQDSDLGYVWKASVVGQIIDGAVRGEIVRP